MRSEIENYMRMRDCPVCKGQRLKPEVLAVTVGDKGIVEVSGMNIEAASEFFKSFQKDFKQKDLAIAKQVLKEINARL